MTEQASESQRLLTAIYVEVQETNKLLKLLAEQQAVMDERAGMVWDEYEPGEFYTSPPEEYFRR